MYTKMWSAGVTAENLGVMGATLANCGVNPLAGKRLLTEEYVPELLSRMLTAGLYNESSAWSYYAGLPAAKTGLGGGVIAAMSSLGVFDALFSKAPAATADPEKYKRLSADRQGTCNSSDASAE